MSKWGPAPADGSIEIYEFATARLVRLHRLADHDLLASGSDLFAEAYSRQAKRIAYAKPSAEDETA